MKCSFCGKNFKTDNEDQDICPKCIPISEELSNGRGDDEDE